ncbi:hypothetical protein GOV07_04300 [Candidatus Woesearchaeota archaeon]|nr:hypothetical protein [Candidatus Woesearchaeota archaeon]
MSLLVRCDEILSGENNFSPEERQAVEQLGERLLADPKGENIPFVDVDFTAQVISHVPLIFMHGTPVMPSNRAYGPTFKKWLGATLSYYQEMSMHTKGGLAKRTHIGPKRLADILGGHVWPTCHEVSVIAPPIELRATYLVSFADYESMKSDPNTARKNQVLARRRTW